MHPDGLSARIRSETRVQNPRGCRRAQSCGVHLFDRGLLMQPVIVFFLGLGLILGLLIAAWLIQLVTRNAGLVDAVWSGALGLTGVLYALLGDAPTATRIVLIIMAGGWGLRLSAYLATRMRGRPEDSRYAAARQAWGRRVNRNMLGLFLFQGIVAWILSLPFLVIAFLPANPSRLAIALALLLWAVSVAGEGLADGQLHRFTAKPDNRGKTFNGGLWRYSRHPNYFFESLHWVSYVIFAFAAPLWWLTLASPVIMAVLLLKVSGIPTIENRQVPAKRQGHDAYLRTTSAFIPWCPGIRPGDKPE